VWAVSGVVAAPARPTPFRSLSLPLSLDPHTHTKLPVSPLPHNSLPGFTDPWDAAFVRGHALAPPGGDWSKLTVAGAGLAAGGALTLVRRALVPEKWNLVETGKEGEEEEEEDLDSTDEEEEDDPLEGEGRWCGL
jgi:hypothetical protein